LKQTLLVENYTTVVLEYELVHLCAHYLASQWTWLSDFCHC